MTDGAFVPSDLLLFRSIVPRDHLISGRPEEEGAGINNPGRTIFGC
jgi:hypothetical protein